MKTLVPKRVVDATAPPFTNLWLLWLGAGLNACLSVFGFGVTLSLTSMVCCWALWLWQTVDHEILYCSLLFGLADIFFREVEFCGGYKIPHDGAVIFVCAPHANQLFDPILVMKVVDNCVTRRVSFLAAAKTMRRRFVGMLARGIKCIPVERAQDLAKRGVGVLVTCEEIDKSHHLHTAPHSHHHRSEENGQRGVATHRVVGRGTKFTQEIMPGDHIRIPTPQPTTPQPTTTITSPSSQNNPDPLKNTHGVRVVHVVSDTVLEVDGPLFTTTTTPSKPKDEADGIKFTILPYVDQSKMFDQVFDQLSTGRAVGIFPEGGSHDRSQLLPLKAGVSMMALGAMTKYPGLNVRIVPVGLNYEQGHRFRSKVLVDIGDPLEVPTEILHAYQSGKEEERKQAAGKLLEQVLVALRGVVTETSDHQTLRMLHVIRRLLHRVGHVPTPEERLMLTRELANGYERCKDDPKIKAIMKKIDKYDKDLKAYGLKDHQVAKLTTDERVRDDISLLVIRHLVLVCAYTLFVLPGLFLSFPVLATARYLSTVKARQAAKQSSVKLSGRDVVATWKVLIGMVMIPVVHALYTLAAFWLGGVQLAVVYFFFAPFVCSVGIKCTENGLRVWRSLGVLLLDILHRGKGERLRLSRNQLKKEVREVVREFGWLSALEGKEKEWKRIGASLSSSHSDLYE